MRKKSSKERALNIEAVLKRDRIPYKKHFVGDHVEWELNCAHSVWREVFDDAVALEEEKKNASGLPVVSYATLMNVGKMRRLGLLGKPVLLCEKDIGKLKY